MSSTDGAPDRVAWFRKLLEIRLFEERVQELFMSGQVQGSTHLCQGQEAVSVGAIAAMGSDDVLTNTYRGHGEALARGMNPETAFAELMGKATGSSRGVGGSMHFADPSVGNMGANAIIGAGMPIAVGCAMAFRFRNEPRIAITFFGDGATNIGTFHESLNMAALWKAPVVFIAVNNLYGEYSPLATTTATTDLARRADPFGIPSSIVDGQDIDAVYAETSRAVERARVGGGPTFLEMKTYRYRGHSRSDPAKYRPEGELDAWKARDPIDILGARLDAEGVLGKGAQASMREETRAAIDAASERAAAAPVVTIEEIRDYVYAH